MSFQKVEHAKPVGRVISVSSSKVIVSGLETVSGIGDHVSIIGKDGGVKRGEVIEVSPNQTSIAMFDELRSCKPTDRVVHDGEFVIHPDESWKGRVLDAFGAPLDGLSLVVGTTGRSTLSVRSNPMTRMPFGPRVNTGYAIFDTVLPVALGQRLGIFAPAGVGKSSLMNGLISGIDADVVVVALVGERSREAAETYRSLMRSSASTKFILVVATSDELASTRRQCFYTATTICEHFRDEGQNVAFFVDSVTRFAEAHREMACGHGEAPALRGHPPSLVHRLNGLCERTGTGTDTTGSITSFYTVLVAGNDHDEPVADVLRGILDGHIILDRSISEQGRYPAVDVLRSVSRSLPDVASSYENKLIHRTRTLLRTYEENWPMVKSGLYAQGTDRDIDQSVRCVPALHSFFSKQTDSSKNAFFELESLIGDASLDL